MAHRSARVGPVVASLFLVASMLFGSPRAAAAPGDLVADIATPEGTTASPLGIAKAVGYDGQYLYYAEYMGQVLHRIDVPPRGASVAAGHVDIPIVGAPTGIMSISWDRHRGAFWANSGDGGTIYLLTTGGVATRIFTIDPATLNGRCSSPCQNEAKINYDSTDDTIWFAPDTTHRVYHFATTPDVLGRGVLVASSPYLDVDVPPNDMTAQCGYSHVSGLATGGAHLFFAVSGCFYYFEYAKDGTRIAAIPRSFPTSGDFECDDRSFSVSVIWARDGWNGHIYAIEQPAPGACLYGGGP